MRQSISTGLGALIALAFVSVMATAAPPDAFHAELIQTIHLDAPSVVADDVSFDTLGDEGSHTVALAAGEYQTERMPGMVAAPALSLIALTLNCSEVGVLFDPLGKLSLGATVKA